MNKNSKSLRNKTICNNSRLVFTTLYPIMSRSEAIIKYSSTRGLKTTVN